MKSIILVALALVAVAAAVPEEPIPIIKSEYVQQPEGGYQYNFETQNGILRSETGEVKEVIGEDNKPQKVIVVRGSYSYPNLNGLPRETVNYRADETGYYAEGDSIPKPTRR